MAGRPDSHRRWRGWRHDWWMDLRFGVRSLGRTPGVAAAIVVMLSLGIGANAAMYSLLGPLFLHAPAQIRHPDTVHRVYVRQADFLGVTSTHARMEWSEFTNLRDDTERFSVVAGYTYPSPTRNGRGQAAQELQVSWATEAFFELAWRPPSPGPSRWFRRRRSPGPAGGRHQRRLLATDVRSRARGDRGDSHLRREGLHDRRYHASGVLGTGPERGRRVGAAHARRDGPAGRRVAG